MLPTGASTIDPDATSDNILRVHGSAVLHKDNRLGLIGGISYVFLFAFGCWLLPRLRTPSGVVCLDGGREIQDTFPGPLWRTSQTESSRLLLSDSRMRVESHTILGEDGKKYTDWIWMDVIDQINVMPYVLPAPTTGGKRSFKGGKFRVFRQKKYGLKEESLAVCGGQVEMAKNELPLAAAKRELEEEMSLHGDSDSWVDLGSYRVNVNRGHGIISCFLLLDAREVARVEEEFHVDELERQSVVELTVDQMELAVKNHEFGEIKWQATAAMALAEVKERIRQEESGQSTVDAKPTQPPRNLKKRPRMHP